MRLVVLSRTKARLRAETSKSLLFACFSHRLILRSAGIAPAPAGGNGNAAAPLVPGIAVIPAAGDGAAAAAAAAATAAAAAAARGDGRFFSCLFTSLASHS